MAIVINDEGFQNALNEKDFKYTIFNEKNL